MDGQHTTPTPTAGYRWRIRQLMAAQDLWRASELRPLLRGRGVDLSAAQVRRLVAEPPQRLALDTLVALCHILGCSPGDLIEVHPDQAEVLAPVTPLAPQQRQPQAAAPESAEERPPGPTASPEKPTRVVSVRQDVSATPSDFGLAGARRAYVFWPPGARRGTDHDRNRAPILGMVWQDPAEPHWHATAGDSQSTDVGGPFRTLQEAREAIEAATAPRNA